MYVQLRWRASVFRKIKQKAFKLPIMIVVILEVFCADLVLVRWNPVCNLKPGMFQRNFHIHPANKQNMKFMILVTGLSILAYIFIKTNKCTKVITLLWCLADAPTCFGASAPSSGSSHDPHMLLVGVHYRSNAISSEVDMVNRCFQQRLTIST
jgi:hypothetical protein